VLSGDEKSSKFFCVPGSNFVVFVMLSCQIWDKFQAVQTPNVVTRDNFIQKVGG
jgi:hypothetical protein